MRLGYDKPLYLLAFDHRSSLTGSMLDIKGEPDDSELSMIRNMKWVAYQGLRIAIDDGVPPPESAGFLVDERYGSEVAIAAREAGLVLALAIEKSGQAEFDFEYGADYAAHIEEFDPTFAKVLVRYNPEGDRELNTRQALRLVELSELLHERGRLFLFELLVPAEPWQLEAVGGNTRRYDEERRPELMLRALAELQEAGIEPDLWKIEGLDKSDDCARVVAQARAGDRQQVGCVVLGRGADETAVDRWLEAAAPVPGYQGFAIGRSIWWQPLQRMVEGDIDDVVAARQIAARYGRFVQIYEKGRRSPLES